MKAEALARVTRIPPVLVERENSMEGVDTVDQFEDLLEPQEDEFTLLMRMIDEDDEMGAPEERNH